MRETAEMYRAGRKKKRLFCNAKHAICTTNCWFVALQMRFHEKNPVQALLLILAQLILVGASTFILSLTVKGIIPQAAFCVAIQTFHCPGPRPTTNVTISDGAIVRECSENTGLQMHRTWL